MNSPAMSWAHLMFSLFSAGRQASLLPSSIAASSSHTLASPRPFILLNSSGLASARCLSPLLSLCKSSLASSSADLSLVPVLSRIARTSAVVRVSAPYFSSFSLGFSQNGISFIFIHYSPFPWVFSSIPSPYWVSAIRLHTPNIYIFCHSCQLLCCVGGSTAGCYFHFFVIMPHRYPGQWITCEAGLPLHGSGVRLGFCLALTHNI